MDAAPPRDRRRVLLTLITFLALAFASAYLMQVNGWNQNAHYALIRALADGTPRIDVSRHEIGDLGTGDVSIFDGHVYSNKAPGLAFVSMPAYGVVVATGMRTTGDPTRVIWALHLWAVTVPFVVLLLLVRWAGDVLEPGYGLAAAATLGLATLVLPFSTMLFAHVLSTALGFASFALLARERRRAARTRLVAAAGLLTGLGIATEYSFVLIGAVLGVYALRTRVGALRRGLFFAGGVAVGILPILLYNAWAFGSPVHSTYDNNYAPLGGFQGIGSPDFQLLFDVLFSAMGLVTLTPVVVCGVVGAVVAYRRDHRPEWLVVCAVMLVALAWAACFRVEITVFGGQGPPRYLIMFLPFFALGLGHAYRRFPVTTLALAAVSGFQMVGITATNALAAYDGDWTGRASARNFTQTAVSLVGITGWYTISLFLGAVVVAAVAATLASARSPVARWELVVAPAAVLAWALVALGAKNYNGLPPGTGYVAVLAFVVAAAATTVAVVASVATARRMARVVPHARD